MRNSRSHDFSYGKPNATDPEDARSLTSVWTPHVPSQVKIDSNSVDFKALNSRMSRNPRASAKLLNSEAKAIKLKQAVTAQTAVGKTAIEPVEHGKANLQPLNGFGKPTRPGTPVRDLINNKFGNEGEQATAQRYNQYYSERVKESQTHTTIKETKASLGRTTSVQALNTQPEREPFKLSKFKKTQSRIKQIWSATVQPPTGTAH